MDDLSKNFRNVILCDDIRDEPGGRHSLMGVLAADILVPSFPAILQLALYFQYFLDDRTERDLMLDLHLQIDDVTLAKATVTSHVTPDINVGTFVLPKGYATFEKEGTFRVLVSVNGAPEELLLSKKLGKLPTS